MKAIHKRSYGAYGGIRLTKQLKKEGRVVNRKKVYRLQRTYELFSKKRKPFRVTTHSKPGARTAPNILDRDFTAHAPNEKYVSDITYIPTREGFLYLAVIIDLFSRMVVGFSLLPRLTEDITLEALQKAYRMRLWVSEVLFHSDRGSQYTSNNFLDLLDTFGIKQSHSRTGNCWDNSVSESFFATLKWELMEGDFAVFDSRLSAAQHIEAYIRYYNFERLHSTLGYVSPVEFETAHRLSTTYESPSSPLTPFSLREVVETAVADEQNTVVGVDYY